MFKFVLKGVFRDRHRWLFPVLIVVFAVGLMVFAYTFMEGFKTSYIRQNARFNSGHLKVVSRAYAEMLDLKPYDLALMDVTPLLEEWKKDYPQLDWVERINFGAILDVPDEEGDTRVQTEVLGIGVDLLGSEEEQQRLRLAEGLRNGRIPDRAGELLLSASAANSMGLEVGDTITLMSSTVFGAMTLRNFVISGTVEFGAPSLDRGAVVADLKDIRDMLDMQDAAGEILAYFKNGEYNVRAATEVMNGFNERYSKASDEFSPQMLRLNDQGNMGPILKMFDYSKLWMSIGFIFVLSIVLWNAGLLNGIRRYGEFGLRLAIGESKSQVYLALTAEAAIVGIVGGLLGILLGLAISLYFNNIGMDMSAYTRSSAMMIENTLYTTITPQAIILSFIPGLVSTIFGAALAGLAIFKRETSQLTKELET